MGFRSRSSVLPPIWFLTPVVGFVIVGMVLPGILILVMSAGQHSPSFLIRWEELNPANYTRFIKSTYAIRVLFNTVVLCGVVAAINVVLGYPVAYFFARYKSRFQKALFYITLAPMAVGINMLTLGWMIVLGKFGFVNATLIWLGIIHEPLRLLFTWATLVAGLAHVTFPFMVLPIAAVLKNIEPGLEQAARNLGAGPVRTFLHVTLPLSFEGIAAGFLIVFMQVLGGFVMPLLLGGGKVMVLTVMIWEQITVAFNNNYACTIATVLLGAGMVSLFLQIHYFRLRRS